MGKVYLSAFASFCILLGSFHPLCFFHCVCVLTRFSHVRLCETPWTVVGQAPLSMGFFRQEYWSGLSCPPPEDLPVPGIKPESPALAGVFFTTSVSREASFISFFKVSF